MSDQGGEDEFLEKHARIVYNLALRLVGNPVDAEDLAQDALLRALKALPSYRGDCSPATWVYRITLNAWKNKVRSEKRRNFWKLLPLHLLFGEDGSEEKSVPSADPPLDAGIQTEETARTVQKALLELDEDSRAVVVLRDIEGLPYGQIAASLGLPEGTVKSRLCRARNLLKTKLSGLARTQ